MTTADSPFVHACLLDRAGHGTEIDAAAVQHWDASQGLLWLHLETGNPQATDWLDNHSGMPAALAEILHAGETRPRTIATDDGLLIILRAVNLNPGANPEDMVSVRIWIEADRIITVRRRRLLSVQDVRRALEENVGPRTSGEFLVRLIERISDRIGEVIGRIDAEIDSVEDEAGRGRISELLARTTALRRQTAAIRRYLAPQREALNRIRGRTTLLSPQDLHDLEELSDVMTRNLENLELLREQAILIHEQLASRMAAEQNQRLYVLSIVAAIFLPLSFITGLFGMNLAGIPGAEFTPAFWIACASMGGIAAGLIAYFRYRRWI